jgi:hypothetical protein
MFHRRLAPWSSLVVSSLLLSFPSSATAANPDAPPLGEYYCDYGSGRGQVFGPGRGFFLMPAGEYRALDDEVGTYTYEPALKVIRFDGGFFGRMNTSGEFVGGSYNQIDLVPEDGVYTFCSLQ